MQFACLLLKKKKKKKMNSMRYDNAEIVLQYCEPGFTPIETAAVTTSSRKATRLLKG